MKQERIRRWGAVIIVIIAIAALAAIFFLRNSVPPEDKIDRFVRSNAAELESIALRHLDGDEEIKEYKGVKIDGVFDYPYSDGLRIVQFNYSGFGLVPSTIYYGFYYSEDNVPAVFQNAPYELAPVSEGRWEWSDGTDNAGTTTKIMDGWFYYAAWF